MVALVVSAAVIWKASFAAFVATTSNPGNAWSTGNLVLTATDGNGTNITGSAVFNAAGLRPGSAIADRCITVVYSGTLAPSAALRLYATSTTNAAAVNAHTLSSYLSLRIDEGSGATDVNCTGFTSTGTIFDTTNRSGPTSATVIAGSLMDFTTNQTGWSTGRVTSWTPAAAPPSTSRSYRFGVAFPGSAVFPGGGSDAIDSDLMGMTAQTAFTWEVQN